jgi:hypothetical protein
MVVLMMVCGEGLAVSYFLLVSVGPLIFLFPFFLHCHIFRGIFDFLSKTVLL